MKRSYLSLSVFLLLVLTRVASGEEKLTGQWDFYLPSPEGVKLVLAEFSENQGRYVGSFTGEQGTVELSKVSFDGTVFSFEHEIEKLFMTINLSFQGRVKSDSISGEIETPMGQKTFKGSRR